MTTPVVAVPPAALGSAVDGARTTTPKSLPIYRLNIMRIGYAVMAVGLVVTRWPAVPGAASLPLYEGVVTALLTAMSLLALLGLRYPVQLLPLLVFESAWKLIWLVAVAIPHLAMGDMGADMGRVLFSVSLVVVILAVTPWDYVWQRHVRAGGDAWR